MRNIAPFLAASLLVFSGNVAALGGAQAQDTTASPVAPAPLVVCLPRAPVGLDPARGFDGGAFDLVSRAVFDTLVTLGRGGRLIAPQLAQDWDISDDRRQYTFRLRSGVVFHKTPNFEPTRPLGAEDVVFTFQRLIDPAHPLAPPGGAAGAADLAAMIESVQALGGNEVRFTLKTPQSGFLMMLSEAFAGIQSAEYAARLRAARQGWMLDTHPVGTGAFSVKTIGSGENTFAAPTGPRPKPGFEVIAGAGGPVVRTFAAIPFLSEAKTKAQLTRIEFSANASYWQGPPNTDRLVFDVEPDIATRFGRLTSGQCQIMPGPARADIDALTADPEIDLTEAKGADTLYLAFNTEQKPVNDKWVRLALAEAIDVDALARLQGIDGTPARAILHNAGDALPVERHIFSLDFARTHLAGAGVEAPKLRFVVPVTVAGGATPLADAIAEAWKDLGVRVTIDKRLWADMLPALVRGEYDVALLAWRADGVDLARNYRKVLSCDAIGKTNASRWCDTAFTADLMSIAEASSPAGRQAATIKAAQRVATELPILPLVYLKRRWAVRTEVMGLDAAALAASDLTQAMIGTPVPMGGPMTDPDTDTAPGEPATTGNAG